MPYPLISTLSGTVTYSNTTLFDGWAVLLIAYPDGYTSASIANQLVPQTVAQYVRVRVQQGVYDQSARIIQNSCLEPPNTQYAAYYYDNNNVNLGHTGLFTVSSSPYTITQPTLTSPAATAIIPTPGCSGGSSAFLPNADWYDTTTPPDGIRTEFYFPYDPNIVTFNGVIQFEGISYTKSYNGTSYVIILNDYLGNIITPTATDVLREGL